MRFMTTPMRLLFRLMASRNPALSACSVLDYWHWASVGVPESSCSEISTHGTHSLLQRVGVSFCPGQPHSLKQASSMGQTNGLCRLSCDCASARHDRPQKAMACPTGLAAAA